MTITDVACGDYDGNGHIDIALAAVGTIVGGPNDGLTDPIAIAWGRGNSTFEVSYLPESRVTGALVAGDLNHDGITDLVSRTITHQPPKDSVFLSFISKGLRQFTTVSSSAPAGEQLVLDDVDRDNNVDLVQLGWHATVLYGHGDGTFSLGFTAEQDGLTYLALADVDGDGMTDLVSTSGFERGIGTDKAWELEVMFNRGSRIFDAPIHYALPAGRPNDLILASYGPHREVGVFLPPDDLKAGESIGMTSLPIVSQPANASHPNSFAVSVSAFDRAVVADFDGNGSGDVFWPAGRGGPVFLYLGRGDGTFAATTALPSWKTRRVFVGDFDENGAPDFAVAQGSRLGLMINRFPAKATSRIFESVRTM